MNTMMIYSIQSNEPKKRVQFHRKLFAITIKSHNGKYRSKTTGILKKYQRPIGSCVFFENKMLNSVKKICEEFRIKYTFYKIEEISK